jgi:serine/threonine-protein kinase RsbW
MSRESSPNMAWVEEFETTIPNDTAAALEVQERIVGRLEELGYPARDVFGCRLALEEALVNAIKHGNDNDPSKSVRIECRLGADRFEIEIEDEGPGFEPEDVPDPTAEENLEKPSGRGIMLMRAFMTRVDYQGRGNRVLLEKDRGNGDGDED